MTDTLDEKALEAAARGIFAAADDTHNFWPTPEHPECRRMARAAIAAYLSALTPPEEVAECVSKIEQAIAVPVPRTGNPVAESNVIAIVNIYHEWMAKAATLLQALAAENAELNERLAAHPTVRVPVIGKE